MEDSRFRRNVIVQYLVLFQYLNGFSQAEKDNTAKLLASRGSTKQSLIQPNYILKDEQVEWIADTKELLLTLLRSTKPHGNLYTEIILTILANERHWVISRYVEYVIYINLFENRLFGKHLDVPPLKNHQSPLKN